MVRATILPVCSLDELSLGNDLSLLSLEKDVTLLLKYTSFFLTLPLSLVWKHKQEILFSVRKPR